MTAELIPIKQIKQSSQLQPRARMDTGKIDEYTESMKRGDAFPAVMVFRIGGDLFLVDGYHRFMAAQGAKLDRILAEVRAGTIREAILHSAGVNSKHGLNRTNEDKRRAAGILLKDKEWGQWSDAKIAEVCHVSVDLVATVRKSILGETDRCTPEKRKVERAGKVFKMDTSKIGKKPEPGKKTAAGFPDHVPPAAVTVPIPSDPAKPPQPSLASQQAAKEMHVNPGSNVTINPVIINDTLRQSPFRTGAEVKAHDKDPLGIDTPTAPPAATPAPVINPKEEMERRARAFIDLISSRLQLETTDLMRNHHWQAKDVLCLGIDALVEKEGKR